MSAHHADNDVGLLHTGFPAYLRLSNTPIQSSSDENIPPLYDGSHVSHSMHFRSTTDTKNGDEEWNCGFWGERNAPDDGQRGLRLSKIRKGHYGFYELCCFWFAVAVYIVGALVTFYAIDLVFAHFDLGIGLASWPLFRSHSTNRVTYNIHFCLASSDREVPGTQTWRYISPSDIAACMTEVITLIATSTEDWRLQLNDEDIFGGAAPHISSYDEGYGSAGVEDQVNIADMGDDLATEGEATSWHLYPRRYRTKRHTDYLR